MPELPEVQRAVNILNNVAKGKRVSHVETFPDTIVFTGTDHEEFGKELENRVILNAKRHGKVFYLTLDGDGKSPVLHFGMTGMLQVKGVLPMYYKEAPRKTSNNDEWPPRFCKFVLKLQNTIAGNDASPPTEIAFCDPRRLARIRLCANPTAEPPISALGFDPLHSMPPLPTFSRSVLKRTCPIKALLLDQSFSAGIGNWVADEVLYQARVHPEQRCNTLSEDQVKRLYENIVYVCQTAVNVDADAKQFPEDWLFRHRWGKGKKNSTHTLTLPSGGPATIKWITVGGRTSAYVVELQKLPVKRTQDEVKQESEESAQPLMSTAQAAKKRKQVSDPSPSQFEAKRSRDMDVQSKDAVPRRSSARLRNR